ncbi:hypothetical protein EJB05_32213, partial [Eragrostis curvula]
MTAALEDGRPTCHGSVGLPRRASIPVRASSDHAPTSELSALPSTSTWLVHHDTVKPPHANDTTCTDRAMSWPRGCWIHRKDALILPYHAGRANHELRALVVAVHLGEAGARIGCYAAGEQEEVVQQGRQASLEGRHDGVEVGDRRLGIDAEHAGLYGLWQEVEVGDGEDVRLDGGVGGLHEAPAHDPDI